MKLSTVKRNRGLAIALAFSFVTVVAVAANAEEAVLSNTDGFLELSPRFPSIETDEQIEQALQSLVGRQSQAEIDALAQLPHTTLLADESGHYLAAVNTGPFAKWRVIAQMGPVSGTSEGDASLQVSSTDGW